MMEIALVYDRVNKFGGAERVLLALHEIFPQAPLYTSVYNPVTAPWAKVFPSIYTSFLQNVPFAKNNHELFGWLMPVAFEQFNFDNYDLVISVTSEAAKGIITKPKTLHICYCLTPTRYLWSGNDFYMNYPPQKLRRIPFFKFLAIPFIRYLKSWDLIASQRPDVVIAISTEVQKRIIEHYKRDSEIIFPPVDTQKFENLNSKSQKRSKRKNKGNNYKDYYLAVGRFEPYKRLDLIIDSVKSLERNLVVAGSGSEFERYKEITKNEKIMFINNPDDDSLGELFLNAKALIMAQEEDFGIVAVEAQSAGTPVITYNKGGSSDTVINGKTGIYFEEQTVESLSNAIIRYEKMNFDSKDMQIKAKNFDIELFKKEFTLLIKKYIDE